MANLPETPQWEEGIYQIEVSDPVLGGPDGISNRQAKQLASRTSYLKQKVEKGAIDFAEHIAAPDPHIQYAPKASPVFTGNPTAPTPAVGDNSKKLPTTEFVVRALAAATGSDSDLMKEIGKKLAKDQNGADVPDPALFVKNLGLSTVVQGDRCYLVGFASGEANQPYMMHFASQEVVKLATAESPTFTGAPLVPDALPGNYGQQAANTKFVHDKIAELVNSSPDTLDTLKELADALGNDAHFATTMANALAGKQPKDQVLTDLSGKTVGGILAYLGLKTAAQKDVGTGPNQIPDMGGFTASLGVSGWATLPNGLIFQWGMAGQLTPQNPDAIGSFNITFPNKCLFITEHDQGNAARKSVIQIGYVTNTGFTMYNMGVLDRQIPSGLQAPVTVTVPWFAIGY